MGLVSVVVPVFAAQEWLPRCLESLAAQTHPGIEVVVVSDGSPDESPRIAAAFAGRDPRFRLLERERSGVSGARNAGMRAAGGEHLMFVDADDFVEGTMVERLLAGMGEDVDLVVCGHVTHDLALGPDMGRNVRSASSSPGLTLSAAEIARDYWGCYDRKWINPVWNKLYRASIVRANGLRFPQEVAMGEDGNFNCRYLMHARAVRVVGDALYHYVLHPRQSSRATQPAYFATMTANYDAIEAFVAQHDGFADAAARRRHEQEFFQVLKHAFHHIAGERGPTWGEKARKVGACLADARSRRVLAAVEVAGLRDRAALGLMRLGMRRSLVAVFTALNALHARGG